MIADRYEVDPKYFADKYNMPVGERRQQQVPSPDPDDDKDPKKQHNARPFSIKPHRLCGAASTVCRNIRQ